MRKGDELWEIVNDGVRLIIVADGKQAIRKFISADHAKVQHDKLVRDKLETGWELTSEAPTVADGEPREPALEAAIERDPFDANAYAVYGDWYQARQHPRGELIALQLAGATDASEKHILRYREQLLGDLARFSDAFGWRSGFIQRLTLDDAGPAPEIARALLRHPSGRLLTEATLRLHDAGYLERALGELMAAPHLRSLSVTTGAQIYNLGGLERFDKLRALSIRSYGAAPPSGTLAVLARVPPTLESLDLFVRATRQAWDELAPLFARTDLALRHIGMRAEELVDQMLCALADGPLAPHLETLDLGRTAPEDGMRALLAKRARFAKLRTIALAKSLVDRRAQSALEAAGIDVVAYEPEDETDYYDEVGE